MDVIHYNRLQAQKHYKITTHTLPPPYKIHEYDEKIKQICKNNHCNSLPTEFLIKEEGIQDVVDKDYLKYLFYCHLKAIVNYILNQGIQLIDIEWNIKLILNDIVNRKCSESYYQNTIEIYEDISEKNEPGVIDVINQAIRLNNIKILYYIYYAEEERIDDRIYEVIG